MNAYERAIANDWETFIGDTESYEIDRYVEYFNEGTYAYNPGDLFAEVDHASDEYYIRVYDGAVLVREFYNGLDEFIQWVEKRESEAVDND